MTVSLSSSASHPWGTDGGSGDADDDPNSSSPLVPAISSNGSGSEETARPPSGWFRLLRRQRPTSSSAADESSAGNPALKAINRGLYAIYTTAGLFLTFPVALGNLPAAYAQTLVATMWLGFVLAISGMEAWVKFRAPFCPRAYKLDIGRTVFKALNSVEGAFCTTLWMLYVAAVRVQHGWFGANVNALPLAFLTATLLLDVVYLTPKLDRNGQRIVRDYMTTSNPADHSRRSSNTDSSAEGERDSPNSRTGGIERHAHVVYVALELFKVIGLAICLRAWFPVYVLNGIML